MVSETVAGRKNTIQPLQIFHTTSGKVKDLLAKRYCAPEWATFFEVATNTGAGPSRFADAVAMNLWPSRGLAIHGFEIKVHRSDWLNELKNPAKAEAMARNCDHWWIVAAKGVVREGELPSTWGLIEVDGRGLTAKVAAPRLARPELTRDFMASMMRRCGEVDSLRLREAVQAETEAVHKRANDRIENEVKRRTSENSKLREDVAAFEEASGIRLTEWYGGKDIGAAVKLVRAIGPAAVYSAARSLAEQATDFAERLRRELDSLQPVEEGEDA